MKITRRYALGLSGTLAAVGALAACGNNGGGGGGDASGQIEVFTWWAQGSEKAGLDALVEVFKEQHPDIEFVNGAVAGGAGSAAKDMLQSRLQAGDPPDTFQAHAGAELLDYIDAAQITDVSDLYDEYGLREAFPDALVERLTVDDAIYSVPSNIHRSNVVWGSRKVLEEAGEDPSAVPADLDAFIDQLQKLKDGGVAVPLSVATTWTQVNLLEAVMMAEMGADPYNGLFDGSTDWNDAAVTSALQKFEKMMEFTNSDRDSLDWPDATQLVIDGGAAYNIMGDWAVAAFEQAGQTEDDFVYFELPGKEKIFGFLADSFTLPEGAPNAEGAKAWLDTISSVDGQLAFNKAKGSIPARTDADTSDFSAYAQTAVESFANDAICSSIAHGAATSVAWLNAISDATSRFTSGASNLEDFQKSLADAAEQYTP